MKRYLPLFVFIGVAGIGLAMAGAVWQLANTASSARFNALAEEAAGHVKSRVERHLSLLIATKALFEATNGQVSREAFSDFVSHLDLRGEYGGIQGVGYARMIKPGEERMAEAQIANGYGFTREIWPESSEPLRTPIVLLEPDDERNHAALGYDMFSEEKRRKAMIAAVRAGRPQASAPVELVQEITDEKQAGFLVYVPFSVKRDETQGSTDPATAVDGFIYAPFRAGDLHAVALAEARLPLVINSADVTDGLEEALFRSSDFDALRLPNGYAARKTVEIAGRTWNLDFAATEAFSQSGGYRVAGLLALLSLLLAGSLAGFTRSQMKARAAAEELNTLSEKTIAEKDLLLQEMKHRIKNSLARVLAIARHTATNANTVEDFNESFSARLQAMAAAQDMLSRSSWQRADLGELLSRELEQVFGSAASASVSIAGPPVEISEKAAQALGLTFHELATNALKYGRVAEQGGRLSVKWLIERGEPDIFRLVWLEEGGRQVGKPARTGFGTRLIEATIKGELGGAIERDYGRTGMGVRISAPLRNLC